MTAIVEVYDPTLNAWQAGTPLPEPRAGLTGTVVSSCLYAIGGEGNDADPRGIFDLHCSLGGSYIRVRSAASTG